VRVTLAEARPGDCLQIKGKDACSCCSEALSDLGLHVGEQVRLIRAAPFCGPLLVEVLSTGAQIALGRGIADKVRVERSDAPA
jgi:Fe2+ transport system protein FeoA